MLSMTIQMYATPLAGLNDTDRPTMGDAPSVDMLSTA